MKGTTAGSILGPVTLPQVADMWQETFRVKKDIFGEARVAVGGRTEGYGVASGSGQRAKPQRPLDEKEAVDAISRFMQEV